MDDLKNTMPPFSLTYFYIIIAQAIHIKANSYDESHRLPGNISIFMGDTNSTNHRR